MLGLLCRIRRGRRDYLAASSRLKSGNLIVSGFFNEGLGIGRAGDLTALALENASVAAERRGLRHLFSHIVSGRKSLGDDGGVWFIHANPPEAMIALLAHDPKTWQGRYRIGYWAWETPEIPASWVFVARYFHEIWLPSRFVFDNVAAGFERAGQAAQIAKLRLMPHPVAVRPKVQADRSRFGLNPNQCNVLSLFDCDSSVARKNPWAVLAAWQKAFVAPTEKAQLCLKISGRHNRVQTMDVLRSLCAARPDIRLIEERFDDATMDQFIASFDMLISLHRSEGFGLSLFEAMRAGVVVIATAGSGNDDFMRADNSVPVRAKPIAISDPDGAYGIVQNRPHQVWAEPDIEAAAAALREMVDNPQQRHALAQKAQSDLSDLPSEWQSDSLRALPFGRYIA